MQFCPSVYEHAARVIGKSPWEVSRNGRLLSQAHIEAFRLYNHHPVVIGIDIYNLEAEAYGVRQGCRIDRPAGTGVPAIVRHPYSTSKELMTLEPFNPKTDGRVPMVIEAARRVADECPEADVRIPLSGPFSLATNLMGFENLLCEIMTGPDLVARTLGHLVAGQIEFCKEVVNRGLDIAFFESAATPPLLSPQDFKKIEFDALKETMEKTAAVVGHPVPCIIGGDTAPILDSILETGTGYVCCPAGTDQKLFMDKMRAHPDVTVRINMDPGPMTAKNFGDVEKEVDRVFELANNREKVCIGTGCLPFETDPEAVIKTREYILSKNTGRNV